MLILLNTLETSSWELTYSSWVSTIDLNEKLKGFFVEKMQPKIPSENQKTT